LDPIEELHCNEQVAEECHIGSDVEAVAEVGVHEKVEVAHEPVKEAELVAG